MKEVLTDTALHLGKGVTGVAGIQGIDAAPSGSHVLDTILKIVVVLATAGAPLLNLVKALRSIWTKKEA